LFAMGLVSFPPVDLRNGQSRMAAMNPRFLTALPVFNEATHIAGVLDEVRRYSSHIVVIDDGSTDRTPELLATQTDVHLITHEANQGYGAALRSAFDYAADAEYDVLITIDCDGQHEPRLIPALAAAVFPPNGPPVDIVSGSRYLREFPGDSRPPEDRHRINVAVTQALNDRLKLELTDSFCGFKAYRVESLRKLRITELGYAMPLEVWVQAAVLGLQISEFPVPLIYLEEERSFGGSLDDARQRMAYYMEVIEREIAAVSCISETCRTAR